MLKCLLTLALQELYAYVTTEGSVREYRDAGVLPSTWLAAHVLDTLSDIKWKSKDLEGAFTIPGDSLEKMAFWLSQQQDEMGRFTEAGFPSVARYRVSMTSNFLMLCSSWDSSTTHSLFF